MAAREISCKVCSADLPLSGDERPGDEVFCTYCGAPFRVKRVASQDGDFELEEDEY
jgi:hypothetical protein